MTQCYPSGEGDTWGSAGASALSLPVFLALSEPRRQRRLRPGQEAIYRAHLAQGRVTLGREGRGGL